MEIFRVLTELSEQVRPILLVKSSNFLIFVKLFTFKTLRFNTVFPFHSSNFERGNSVHT